MSDNGAKLSQHDQGELQWYFGRGQIAFQRSPFGGSLERASLYNPWSVWDAMKKKGEDPQEIYPDGPITARPTAEVRAISGYTPDDRDLTRFAYVSGRLLKMEKRRPGSARVLETFFGDVGARWGDSVQKRLFGLYSLTPSGKKLLAWSSKEGQLKMADHERIGVQAAIEKQPGQSKSKRRALLRLAEDESLAMLMEANRLWNEVNAHERRRPKRVSARAKSNHHG